MLIEYLFLQDIQGTMPDVKGKDKYFTRMDLVGMEILGIVIYLEIK